MSNGPTLFTVTLPSPSTAPPARLALRARTRRRHDDNDENLCESLRRTLRVGVAALRAVQE
jgi:hypothetical protein